MAHTVAEDDLQGLVFDCDGTLVDTMPAFWLSWHLTCEKHGLHLTEEKFYSLAGTPIYDMVRDLILEAGLQDSLSIDEVLASKTTFNKEAVAKIGTPAIDVVVSIARHYHGKKPLAVASSGNKEDVIESLKSNGIYELFDAVITAEDVTNPKPAPDVSSLNQYITYNESCGVQIFLKAAAAINCDPTKCRGYEDGNIGLTALRAAGMEANDVRTFPGYPSRFK